MNLSDEGRCLKSLVCYLWAEFRLFMVLRKARPATRPGSLHKYFTGNVKITNPLFWPVYSVTEAEYRNLCNAIADTRNEFCRLNVWNQMYRDARTQERKRFLFNNFLRHSLVMYASSVFGLREKLMHALAMSSWIKEAHFGKCLNYDIVNKKITRRIIQEKYAHIQPVVDILNQAQDLFDYSGPYADLLELRNSTVHRHPVGIEFYFGKNYDIIYNNETKKWRFGWGGGTKIPLASLMSQAAGASSLCDTLFDAFEQYCTNYLQLPQNVRL